MSDPCAGPTAFVEDHIAKIRALQEKQGTSSTNSIAGLFQFQRRANPETSIKISDLRHDAESVNELLRSGGCEAIDIDRRLREP